MADIESLKSSIRADVRESEAFADAEKSTLDDLFSFSHLDGLDIERWYWLREPFAWTAICRDPDDDSRSYLFCEPTLDEFERFARRDLTVVVRDELLNEPVADEPKAQFREQLDAVLADHHAGMGPATLATLRYYLRRDFLRYGEIDPLMADPDVEDISCDGADVPIFVYHADYGNLQTDRAFAAEELDSLTVRLTQRCGRHLSASAPLLTDTLPDGSRVQLTLESDVAARGSNFTIRKFAEEPFTPLGLARSGTFSVAQLAYLWLCVEHGRSVMFVGPTASGKTTSMNAAALFIPPDHKTVSIEQTREVSLPHDNWIVNVTRESSLGGTTEIDIYDFLSESLHQRPDHIIVGEIRTDRDVVRGFFQAMGTGHAGFTTFHADSPEDTLRRLRHDPLSVPDELISDLDVLAVQAQLRIDDEKVRRCRRLCEVRGDEEGLPQLHDVFQHDPYEDTIEQVANARVPSDIARDEGWTDERLRTELDQRARFLAGLLESGVEGYDTVTDHLFAFARNRERALDRLETEGDVPTIET